MTQTRVIILFFTFLVFSSLEAKAGGGNSQYWISTNTDSDNLGTLSNPYICDTQSKFDYTMNSLPENSTVHILAGTYQTEGAYGWYVKSGQKILGSGIDVTVIQLVNGAPSGDYVIASHVGTNMAVSGLTVDGNYTSGTYSYFGLVLTGTGLTISKVKAINLAFFDTTVSSEAWGIGCNAFGYGSTIQSKGNLIINCEVSDFQGGSAFSAFFFDGSPTNSISGIMRGNRVYLPTGVPYNYVAFNGAWAQNWLVQGNSVHGGSVGFYGDTGSYSNVIVAHNLFENCYHGVELMNGNRINIKFISNTILLNPNASGYPHNDAFIFCSSSQFAYANIVITGNYVDFAGAMVSGMNYFFLDMNTVNGLTVNNNTVNSSMCYLLNTCNSVKFVNNFDLDRNMLTIGDNL